MILEINLDTCLENKLSVNQYTILYCFFKSQLNYLEHIATDKDYEYLKELGYFISIEGSPELFIVDKNKINSLFSYSESLFDELLSLYPLKVFNGISTRYLRPAESGAKKANDLRVKYNKIVKTKALHQQILKCLEIEINIKRKGNSLYYMQNLETWINQHTWEQYLPLLNQQVITKTKEDEYGQALI
jgi:hypothetical protein